jgi:hypothetical protein
MPKLYEYLGLVIFFYSNEHEPVHVHAQYGEFESKIEFQIVNGVLKTLKVKTVMGRKPLPAKHLKNFKHLTDKLSDEIIQSWINYFVYHKKIVSKKIQGKL